jgi:hypothetical protein
MKESPYLENVLIISPQILGMSKTRPVVSPFQYYGVL